MTTEDSSNVQMPTQVRIGAQIYKIELRDPMLDGMLSEGNYGYTTDPGNLIVIDQRCSESRRKQVLMHELLHAMRMVLDNSVQPKRKDEFEIWEHFFIGIYEDGFVMLLQDNPKLVEWLIKK